MSSKLFPQELHLQVKFIITSRRWNICLLLDGTHDFSLLSSSDLKHEKVKNVPAMFGSNVQCENFIIGLNVKNVGKKKKTKQNYDISDLSKVVTEQCWSKGIERDVVYSFFLSGNAPLLFIKSFFHFNSLLPFTLLIIVIPFYLFLSEFSVLNVTILWQSCHVGLCVYFVWKRKNKNYVLGF